MEPTTHTLSLNLGDGNSNSGNITGSFNNAIYNSGGDDPSGQPEPPSPNPDEREEVLDWEDSVSKSTDSAISSTELPNLPQPISTLPPKFRDSLTRTATYPNNTRSALSIAVHPHFIIASLVCLLAFLVYRLLLPPNILSFDK